MSVDQQSPVIGVGADVYFQIQQFYAHQMQLLDRGATEEWADTFTEEGVFAANAQPEPVRGRSVIAAGAARAGADFAAKGIQRRHWLGMVSASGREDGTVEARAYALVLTTPKGGQAAIGVSTTMNDILVKENGEWKVRRRDVSRDDL